MVDLCDDITEIQHCTGFIELPLNYILQGTKLYIRKCYSELYEIIKQGSRIAITGTPGIGKSCFLLIYMSSSVYYTSPPPKSRILWFSTLNPVAHQTLRYVTVIYCRTGLVLVDTICDFRNFFDLQHVWYSHCRCRLLGWKKAAMSSTRTKVPTIPPVIATGSLLWEWHPCKCWCCCFIEGYLGSASLS